MVFLFLETDVKGRLRTLKDVLKTYKEKHKTPNSSFNQSFYNLWNLNRIINFPSLNLFLTFLELYNSVEVYQY